MKDELNYLSEKIEDIEGSIGFHENEKLIAMANGDSDENCRHKFVLVIYNKEKEILVNILNKLTIIELDKQTKKARN